jgi:hypothetical protein
MVYLIDDKKSRQEFDYLWTNERFGQYKNIIKCIYTLDELENESKEVFSNDNIILYHESFIDQTTKSKESIDKRNKLYAWSENRGNIIVYFSGSKNTRELNENIANIPVSILYTNLEIFLKKISINDKKIEYLIFGENINIEKKLKLQQVVSLRETFKEEPITLKGTILFLCPSRDYISNPFSQFERKELFSDVSDEKYTKKINDWLNEIKYDHIFLPLCFGNVLSDFNGLRLATHIRCTSSLNQLSSVYIYGFVGMEFLIHNEYFNILKSKNIFLIPFSKKAFKEIENILPNPFTIEELPEQIAKLKLDVPNNYEDNHSIANEWAIYRWTKCIGIEPNQDLEKILDRITNNLYFKYLKIINPIQSSDLIKKENIIIRKSSNPRVLIIDDEIEKGWNELFAYILTDINNIYLDFIGDRFTNWTSEKIINDSVKKIISDDIDIVILDFRLNFDDYKLNNPKEVTSVKLLNEIKKINPGIQVIVFSATQKIWNLQSLQEAEANGFIIKESPENTSSNFTKFSIIDFIQSFETCNELFFLKEFYKSQFEVENKLAPRRKPTHEKALPKEFIDETLKWLRLSNIIFNKGKLDDTKIVASFLFKFSVLENLANRIIDVDNPILIGKNEKGINKYKFQFRISDKRLRNFIEDENNVGFYRKTNKVFESSRYLPWVIKILNTIDFITEEKLSEERLTLSVKKRNDFIHANSTTGSKIEITVSDLIFLNEIIINGLKNIV